MVLAGAHAAMIAVMVTPLHMEHGGAELVDEGGGDVGAPRFFTYWREDPLRAHLTEAGWVVDDVRRGASTPLDRPSESWLAVFATRA